MTPEEMKAWAQGRDTMGRNIAIDIFERYNGDKIDFIRFLYQKANQMADDPLMDDNHKLKWKGYAEAMRHVLNLLPNRGTAMEAYNSLIKNTMRVIVREEEMRLLGSEPGH